MERASHNRIEILLVVKYFLTKAGRSANELKRLLYDAVKPKLYCLYVDMLMRIYLCLGKVKP